MDIHAKLDELSTLLETARAMPMSASCIVNRVEILDRIEELRKMLPGELTTAQQILDDRGSVIAEGRVEAERIVEEAKAERARMGAKTGSGGGAKAERARMVPKTEMVREPPREAASLVAAPRSDPERMRVEIDDYVD